MYGSVLVLSEGVILLSCPREPALELYRLPNLDAPDVASETVCPLPELTMNASLRWVPCFRNTKAMRLLL